MIRELDYKNLAHYNVIKQIRFKSLSSPDMFCNIQIRFDPHLKGEADHPNSHHPKPASSPQTQSQKNNRQNPNCKKLKPQPNPTGFIYRLAFDLNTQYSSFTGK
ncbi:hypothetical protein E2542_SST06758 [Spatholobus suberectus]|nr:hypothetical protein E2542_SST06758 [Spatholobus suberectus]